MSEKDEWRGILPERPGAQRLRRVRKELILSLKNSETRAVSRHEPKLRWTTLTEICDLFWPKTREPRELRNKSAAK